MSTATEGCFRGGVLPFLVAKDKWTFYSLTARGRYIDYYQTSLHKSISQILNNTDKPNDGVFLPSCYDHDVSLGTTIQGQSFAPILGLFSRGWAECISVSVGGALRLLTTAWHHPPAVDWSCSVYWFCTVSVEDWWQGVATPWLRLVDNCTPLAKPCNPSCSPFQSDIDSVVRHENHCRTVIQVSVEEEG